MPFDLSNAAEITSRILSVIWQFITVNSNALVALSTFLIAIYTIILARISRRQIRDARTNNRAYVGVAPAGIDVWRSGDQLVGHARIQNGGNLPANRLQWVLHIDVDTIRDRYDFPVDYPRIKGSHFVTAKGEMLVGSPPIPLEKVLKVRDSEPTCYLYVWGLTRYFDGFTPYRETFFCHRYDYKLSVYNQKGPMGEQYRLEARLGRHHKEGNRAS